jgi:protein arginine N-methyltransferase 2
VFFRVLFFLPLRTGVGQIDHENASIPMSLCITAVMQYLNHSCSPEGGAMSSEITRRVKRAMSKYERVYAKVHREFLAELRRMECTVDPIGLRTGSKYVMYFGERGLMRRHAELLLDGNREKDVLEVGYGLGIFAQEALGLEVKSHTILEVHPALVEMAMQWREGLEDPGRVKIIHSSWQESFALLGSYDAIMYDGSSPPGYGDYDFKFFVEVFCVSKLRSGGLFSFWSPGSSLHPRRERLLHAQFQTVDKHPFRMEPVPAAWARETSDFTVAVARK